MIKIGNLKMNIYSQILQKANDFSYVYIFIEYLMYVLLLDTMSTTVYFLFLLFISLIILRTHSFICLIESDEKNKTDRLWTEQW